MVNLELCFLIHWKEANIRSGDGEPPGNYGQREDPTSLRRAKKPYPYTYCILCSSYFLSM
jgi:hypothetical protein